MRWNRAPDSRRTPIAWRCWAAMAPARSFLFNPSAKWPRQSSTWWSRPLADEWERYLRQQIELGGAEVVVSARPLVEQPTVRPSDRLTGWKKGAPPIPGPGIAIQSPGHVLGDELTALETIEAVAERIRTTHCCGL